MRQDADPLAADKARALSLIPVSRETEATLDRLVGELRRWQAIKNLVGPGTLDAIWTRHVADSAQLAALAPPDATRWVDLGAGAGFPGLVVAALLAGRPGFRMHLVESNARKCAFLRETARMLRLPVEVHAGRIEDTLPRLPGPVDVVSARALAPVPQLLALADPLLKTGALGIFPKGRDLDAELTDSAQFWRIDASTVPSVVDPESRILLVRSPPSRI
jgi:16S rRNA (guanine527-N7)-methyltransferase